MSKCYINLFLLWQMILLWTVWISMGAVITLITWPVTAASWMGLPSRWSHRVITLSETDKRKGSRAATTEPEIFHLLPAWWLLSRSKLNVVKPVIKKKKVLIKGNIKVCEVTSSSFLCGLKILRFASMQNKSEWVWFGNFKLFSPKFEFISWNFDITNPPKMYLLSPGITTSFHTPIQR